MAGGFDVAEAMRGGIGDQRDAWRFIEDFAAAWTLPLHDGDGVEPEELQLAEAELGFAVPDALRQAHLLFDRRNDLTRGQDRLYAPHALSVDDRGEALVFRDENQSVASWGIPMSDVAQPDPPVIVEHDAGWQPFLDRVSLACVEMVLSEVLFGAENLGNAAELPAELTSIVQAKYAKVNFPEYPMWYEPEQPVRWYSAPGQLLRMDGEGDWAWLFVRGRTSDDLRQIYDAIPADWTIGDPLLNDS